MNKTMIAVLLLLLGAGAAKANTMTFSGVVTDIQIESSTGEFEDVNVKIGDPFFARLDWSARFVSATATVGEDFNNTFFANSNPNTNYELDFTPNPVSFSALVSLQPWGGTDSIFGFDSFGFGFYAIDRFADRPYPIINVGGAITKTTVPESGNSIVLAVVGLGAVLLLNRRAK